MNAALFGLLQGLDSTFFGGHFLDSSEQILAKLLGIVQFV